MKYIFSPFVNTPFISHSDEVRSRQCPLLWTWVLEMGMLEIVERLTDKQRGTRGLHMFRLPEGKPYSCLSALDYGGTEDYKGAQMQSGVEVCMWWYARCPPRRVLLAFI